MLWKYDCPTIINYTYTIENTLKKSEVFMKWTIMTKRHLTHSATRHDDKIHFWKPTHDRATPATRNNNQNSFNQHFLAIFTRILDENDQKI